MACQPHRSPPEPKNRETSLSKGARTPLPAALLAKMTNFLPGEPEKEREISY